ncbi:hypothetical protein [Nannocystis bainbridge]|uniref:Uncharacterized protein n=1 Tax=Nannocystis bainbridge TaxID=2995303 RepID=A0ABT5E096_9BACT|nr:hypothetical protein [Nannocystis bainbridge]MDC0718111.1 hypothetical protein [Nannocystis bainbridge]
MLDGLALREVRLTDLSALESEVLVPDDGARSGREFVIVRFRGAYRSGSQGQPDALYITAVVKMALAAWSASGLVVDLRELSYSWGDEMEWIFGLGRWHAGARIHSPVAIVVGDACRAALMSLNAEAYQEQCRDSLADALALLEQKQAAYDAAVRAWIREPG